jgi:Sir2 family
MEAMIKANEIARCPECDGLVKPDILLFGEELPERFLKDGPKDLRHARNFSYGIASLMLGFMFIIGTSLRVTPFSDLPHWAPGSVPRIIMNKEPIPKYKRKHDIYIAGDCDKTILCLCEKLGWLEELLGLSKGTSVAISLPPGKRVTRNVAKRTVMAPLGGIRKKCHRGREKNKGIGRRLGRGPKSVDRIIYDCIEVERE